MIKVENPPFLLFEEVYLKNPPIIHENPPIIAKTITSVQMLQVIVVEMMA